jgi:hypothetical protein
MVTVLATTLQDVRLELAKEDTRLVAQGDVAAHETSLTSFLMTGLELEEHQYVLIIAWQIWLIII